MHIIQYQFKNYRFIYQIVNDCLELNTNIIAPLKEEHCINEIYNILNVKQSYKNKQIIKLIIMEVLTSFDILQGIELHCDENHNTCQTHIIQINKNIDKFNTLLNIVKI